MVADSNGKLEYLFYIQSAIEHNTFYIHESSSGWPLGTFRLFKTYQPVGSFSSNDHVVFSNCILD